MIIAGVMSGSSLDGLDIAIVEFKENNSWELLWQHAMSYSESWVDRLKSYALLSASDYVKLKAEYSLYIGHSLEKSLKGYSGKLDYISFHGHTLVHLPEHGITEQIGNGGTIAALLNKPTFTDFRVQDVAKGGVGTPLAPLVEIELFKGHEYYLNLGGIANITKISESKGLLAYDVCPFNQILNYYSNTLGKEYDKDGLLARTGRTSKSIISYFEQIPYFKKAPPKSLDNNWIKEEFISGIPKDKPENVLNTCCHWMAKCIAKEIDPRKESSSLMVSGGGAHNIYFIECLKEELKLKNCELHIPTKEIIDNKEAILMALMAYKNIQNSPNVLKSVTGASSDSVAGALYQF